MTHPNDQPMEAEKHANASREGKAEENNEDSSLQRSSQERPRTVSSATATLDSPSVDKTDDVFHRDFGFLPIPKYLRHDPSAPVRFDLVLNILFGVASTVLVANLYYCQPLLIQLSVSFNVTYDEVSRIPTLIQAGYATGLLLLTPTGDLLRRRPLILMLAFLSAGLTIGLPITSTIAVFEALSFLVGMTSVVPQIMMPLAADLAPPEKRASALAIVLSGLLFGVLLARVLAGIIANFATWRIVYWLALGLQSFLLVLLYFKLPDYPAKNKHMTYWSILFSMAKFTVTEPVLVQAVIVNMLSMACFTNFWVTMTFLLGGPIYNYSTLIIGLFGLVGMGGVSAAPLIGRTIDKFVPWFASVLASIASLLFYTIQLGAGGVNISAVVIACFGIDVFRQTLQVSLTSAVFNLDASARSRMNAVLIISIFIGQIIGTSAGTSLFNSHGWRAAAALSVGFQGVCLLVLSARGPHCARYTWVGYEGGLYPVRKVVPLTTDLERRSGPIKDGVMSEDGSPDLSHEEAEAGLSRSRSGAGPDPDTEDEKKRQRQGEVEKE